MESGLLRSNPDSAFHKLDQLFSLSMIRFLIYTMGIKIALLLRVVRINKQLHVRRFPQCMAHSEHSINTHCHHYICFVQD